jgi:hypothetical protein
VSGLHTAWHQIKICVQFAYSRQIYSLDGQCKHVTRSFSVSSPASHCYVLLNTLCISCSVFKYFFYLSLYLRDNTFCNYCNQSRCSNFSSPSLRTTLKTHPLTTATILGAQIFLRSLRVSHKEHSQEPWQPL